MPLEPLRYASAATVNDAGAGGTAVKSSYSAASTPRSGLLTGFSNENADEPGEDFKGRIPAKKSVTNYPQESATRSTPPQNPYASNKGSENEEKKDPVDLQADTLRHDESTQTVTASGNVMLVQAGRILRADTITYNIPQDRIVASGNVVLNEENGDIHVADRVELVDEMKNGLVGKLKTYLADGSRFTAEQGQRKDAKTTTMEEASYTPCEPCKQNPDKPVTWQINADKVTHDEEERRISYTNAWFELYGVPIAYTPYFSHPDGSIKQKSGFLSPSFGLDSELGFSMTNSYYWAIAPDMDATIGLRAFTEKLPLMTGEWRKRWDDASLKINGSTTYSDRIDASGGVNTIREDEWRGHLFAKGLWDIDNKWRAGTNIQYASDDQYLRQYDFSSEDVLTNEFFLERFSGRHYSVGRLMSFQDVRIGTLQNEDQPEILPEIVSSWVGEPGSMPLVGGRWSLNGSLLGLRREGTGQDMVRASAEAGWNRRLVSDYGLLTTVDATVRADLYEVKDRDLSGKIVGNDDRLTETRVFPQMNIETSYPLQRNFDRFQMRVEPLVSLTAAPAQGTNKNIPNEDSQDIQLDITNLFEPNRFPGLDRVEDKTRATYGLRTGFYGHEGSSFHVFAGQSYRLSEGSSPFPAGSGLNSRKSDYVGEIYANYKDKYYFDYRFQLDEDNLRSQRHEFDGQADFGKLSVNARYLYANSLEGTAIDQSREQVGGDVAYRWNEEWGTRVGAVQDLGYNPGLRYAYAGIDHYGQCLNWSVSAVRNLTDDASGDSSTELLFRIGLKNLGEFQTSGIELATTSREGDETENRVLPQPVNAP